MRNTRVLAVVVAVCLLEAVRLYTYDVHVPITGNGPPKDSFCGSAYDVVFLKKDGYMGGEVPANQDRIDAACIARARKFVAAAAASGALGVGLLVPLGFALRRGRRPQRAGPVRSLR